MSYKCDSATVTIPWCRRGRVRETFYPRILQHLQEKGGGSTRSAAWGVNPAAVLVPPSLSGGMCASGAGDRDKETKSCSHDHSRFDGEGVDGIRSVEVSAKADGFVVKPKQFGLQHLQPVAVCSTGTPGLDPVPRCGLSSAEPGGTAALHSLCAPAPPKTQHCPLLLQG